MITHSLKYLALNFFIQNGLAHAHFWSQKLHVKIGVGHVFIDNLHDFIQEIFFCFVNGDVVLMDSNLPHYWRFDQEFFEHKEGVSADISVIHFKEDFCGECFINLPENQKLKKVIEQSKQGIQVLGKAKKLWPN